MATRASRLKKVAVSSLVHPFYRRVIRTYLEPPGYEMVELPHLENGRTDLQTLGKMDDLAAIAVQSPNFFGCIEDLAAIGSLTRDTKTLFIASFTEPLAYGLLKDPGSQGADIACGEGQSFGISQKGLILIIIVQINTGRKILLNIFFIFSDQEILFSLAAKAPSS